MKLLDKIFFKLLRWFCENRLDQWERWKLDTKYGPVYISIDRNGDGYEKYNELEKIEELDEKQMEKIVIKDWKEFEDSLTDEQKAKAYKEFRKVYPEGTSEIMCVSEVPAGVNYNKRVDLKDFE